MFRISLNWLQEKQGMRVETRLPNRVFQFTPFAHHAFSRVGVRIGLPSYGIGMM